MTARLLTITLAIFLSGLPTALGSEGAGPSLEPGSRPHQSVFDPSGYLDPLLAKAISEPLEEHLKKDGVDVIVVVLPDLGDLPPEQVARSFAAAWCNSPLHGVVLHVPGSEGSPWIFPGGKLVGYLDPAQVQKAVDDARRRARSESTDPERVKAAAAETADMLRYWMANALNRTDMIHFEKARMRQELETKSQQWKIITTVGAAAVIPLIAGAWMSVIFLRRQAPGYFKSPHYQPRLGAPHAGGNRAVVDLGPPPR
jgi:hypothetical protein